MANQTKRRPKGFSDAELKAYDGLSKTEIFEVLGDVLRTGAAKPGEGFDLAKTIKDINKRINPDSGTGVGVGATDRILSAAQYLALTAISAHAGGMPATLYNAGVQKEHRESFQARGFVQIGDGGAASITPAGNAALDKYEAKQREKAGTPPASGAAGVAGATPPAQTSTGVVAGENPTVQEGQTATGGTPIVGQPIQPVQPTPQAATPAAPAAGGLDDFGG